MKKKVDLVIDKSSWTNAPARFRKLCPFLSAKSPTTFNFLKALLWAGRTGISLRMPDWRWASYWAVLRYVGAADHSEDDLRLHSGMEGLETHSKAVLSDDWGVGISLEWLSRKLKIRQVAHAKIAMPDLVARKVAAMSGGKKRGPGKCPDFLAIDNQGKVHVIECKGNQQGAEQTIEQFKTGRAQKGGIKFSTESMIAQRLLAGIAIASSSSSWNSTLTIADPPPENGHAEESDQQVTHYLISAQTSEELLPSFSKVALIQGLLLAGAFEKAHQLFPKETASEDARVRQGDLQPFESAGAKWLGSIHDTFYPIPIQLTDSTAISGCRLRFGVSAELLSELHQDRLENLLASQFLAIDGEDSSRDDSHKENEHVQRYASIQHGTSLIADLELL